MREASTYTRLLFSGLLLSVGGCIDPFNPPEIDNTDTFLVFDGYVQANGTDTSWIRLSRTQNVHDPSAPVKESNAGIKVENKNGDAFVFLPAPPSREAGLYYLPPTSLDVSQDYRLSITLSNGKAYESDWQRLSVSPPVDSVTYTVNGRDGVQIYVHTHDPTNQTRFYKWTYEETWEYRAPLYSLYEIIENAVVSRETDINQCWSSFNATHINLFTTATLSQDLVRSHPITYIPASTGKLLHTYSIIVRQQALTREAYDYWTELARNNETNGSIFDPFPSQLSGNIRSVSDPKERVFGFFSGGVTQSQRIFVREYLGLYPICFEVDTLPLGQELLETPYLIVGQVPESSSYIVAAPHCADCRLQGGTIRRPPFWP
ncbi:MAG: hypothetical protein ABS46_09515 [Cytophagaceae bacterium SCN 52-12]|nr:MAG: hypothetical protein ABS46_09515 [Cytophagaceae bacterium SCN 52-12]